MSRRHVLVVGGTGMLAECCSFLAGRGDNVTVLGRRQSRIDRVTAMCPIGQCEGIAVDYRNDRATIEALEGIIERRGPFDETVCWVHEDQAPLAHIYLGQLTGRSFYHVLSSQFADPANPARLSELRCRFQESVPGVAYKTIILGFVPGTFGSRWLTNDEISSGVFEAVEREAEQSMIGKVDPWKSRP
ncbi:hypothetical protein [Agrobacterium pusense]|uniref:hypothetical protein n=1 Tax=Agrobacterium pusense TaxID=648995 RepID=UPI003FD125CE